jgi:hypothetical protein
LEPDEGSPRSPNWGFAGLQLIATASARLKDPLGTQAGIGRLGLDRLGYSQDIAGLAIDLIS